MARTEYHRTYARKQRERAKELEEENERLKTELKQAKDELHNRQAQIIDLSERVKERESQVTLTLDEELDCFHDRLLELEKSAAITKKLSDEVASLEKRLTQIEENNKAILTNVDQLKSGIDLAAKNVDQLAHKITSAVDQQLRQLDSKLSLDMARELTTIRDEVRLTVDQQEKRFIDLLSSQIASVDQHNKALMTSMSNLTASVENLSQPKKSLILNKLSPTRALAAISLASLIGILYFFIVQVSVEAYQSMGMDFPPARTIAWELSIAVCFIVALWPTCSRNVRKIFAGLSAAAIAYTLFAGGSQIYRKRTEIFDVKMAEYNNKLLVEAKRFKDESDAYDNYLKAQKQWQDDSTLLTNQVADLQTKYDYVLYDKMSYIEWQQSTEKKIFKAEADRMYGKALADSKARLASINDRKPKQVPAPLKVELPKPQIKKSVIDEILLQVAYFAFILAFKWILINQVLFAPVSQRITQKSSDKLGFSMNS